MKDKILTLVIGILIGIVLDILNILFNNKTRINTKKFITLFIMILLIPVIFEVSINLVNEKMKSSSYSLRKDDFNACIEAWKNNKIFGIGIGNEEEIEKYMNKLRKKNTGLSNSIMAVLAEGGIILFIFYFLGPLINIIKGLACKNFKLISINFIILSLFVFYIFQFTPIAMLILAYSYFEAFNKGGQYSDKTQ